MHLPLSRLIYFVFDLSSASAPGISTNILVLDILLGNIFGLQLTIFDTRDPKKLVLPKMKNKKITI
jgi:hypothetical protein